MDFLHRYSTISVLALCSLLAGGLGTYGTAYSEDEKHAEAQNDQPVTECFESRAGFSSVTRVENVNPKYGYPNVKCSQLTTAVLWYGDPFDGTIPMGEMPNINDKTRGDFANAVVKPRTPQLMYYNMGPNGCETCHDGKTVPYPKNKKPRLIGMHQDIVNNSLELMHGRGAIWCLDCHSAKHRNKLIDREGNEFSFNQPQKLCGSCHGENYIDWRAGIHGKRIGSWKTGGKKRWWVCTECHNPHTVQIERFNPLQPEPPPPLPRGMTSAAYERSGEGGH
jgi:hypothetical protein